MIPSSVRMSDIKQFAFSGCSSLTEITIPPSVKLIDQFAFSGCSSLKKITIPSNVTSIGIYAFQGCSSLLKIEIPSKVTSIGEGAFVGCDSLEEIMVEDSNPSFSSKDGVLFNKDQTNLIRYPGGKGGEYIIPDTVTSLSSDAFSGINCVTAVTIPESLQSIGKAAFWQSKSLRSIKIPNTIMYIEQSAFWDCTQLTDVFYAGSESDWKKIVIEIGGNDPLLNATIHYVPDWKLENGVLTIMGDGVMKDYTFDEHAPWYDKRNEVKQIVIDDNVNRIGNCTFLSCTNVIKVSIGENVTYLGDRAFFGCGMKEVFIPPSVKYIGLNPFQEASNLQKIEVDSNNTFYTTKAGVLYDKSCKKLISYPQGRDNKFFVVPQGVEVVSEYAFGMLPKLTGIYIPFSVKEIQSGVFYGHTRTDEDGYYYTNELSTIYYGAGSEDWADISISPVGNEALLHDVNIFYDVVDIGVCGEKLMWLFFDNGTLSIIGEGKMNDFLAEEAPWFKYNDRIEQINVEEDVESIGDFAFYNCSTKYVDISGSVQSIGTQAFGWCQNLVRIWMPDGPVYFGESAFTNCTSLVSFDVPGSILKLPNYAFANCTCMEYVNIPSTMCEIGNGAFLNCPSLSDVYYAEKQPAWNALVEKIGNENDNLLNAEIHFQESLRIRLEDTWGFRNTKTKEKIDADDYRRFFEDETSEELEQLVAKCDGQGGVCFGMCITAVASYLGYPSISSYGNYNTLSEVGMRDTSTDTNLSVRDFIVLGQIYQYTNQVLKKCQVIDGDTELDNLYDAIYDYQFNNGSPVIIGVDETGGQKRGHAVLALGIQSTEKKNKKVRIMIYNPNLPNKKAYMTLKGTPGYFTGWEIENGAEPYSSTIGSPEMFYFANTSDFVNKIRSTSIKPISSAIVTGISAKTYTGKAITQKPIVEIGSKKLISNTDYTVSYENNTNAGTATIIITGKGNYTGSIRKTFTITKAAQNLTIKAATSTIIVGKTTKVIASGAKENAKYTFKSSNNSIATVSTNGTVTGKAAGTVTITVRVAETTNYRAASKTVKITVQKALKKPGNCRFTKWNNAKYTGCRISWNKVDGAEGYQTLLSWTNGTHSSSTITKSNVLYRDCSVHPQHVSQMKARAFYTLDGKRVYGPWSNVVYVTPSPTKLTTKNASTGSNLKMNVSWNIVYGCNGYNVFVTTNPNGKWYWNQSTSEKASATSATITKCGGSKLKKNTKYYVRIVTRRKRNGVFCTVPMPASNTYIGTFTIK